MSLCPAPRCAQPVSWLPTELACWLFLCALLALPCRAHAAAAAGDDEHAAADTLPVDAPAASPAVATEKDPPPAAAAAASPTVVAEREALLAELERCEAAYRQGVPLLDDEAYDALLARLEELSDTGAVGAGPRPLGSAGTLAHGLPMLSLDKVHDEAGVLAWYDGLLARLGSRPTLWLEPKLDGVALELVYEHGRLLRALTRGDGRWGQDVSALARGLRGVPVVLRGDDPPAWLELRGELVVSRADLRRFQASDTGARFPDGRSLAAGSLALTDAEALARRPLAFVVHGLGRAEGLGARTQTELYEQCARWGFETLGGLATCGGPDAVLAAHRQLLAARDALTWECDGSVIKLERFDERELLGSGPRAPRWALAFKFPGRRASTLVLAVEWTLGRTGRLTPRARLEPVECSGAVVSAVTLHNAAWLTRLGIKVGDRVLLERAGGAVPALLAVLEDAGGPATPVPVACPRCGTALVAECCPSRRCPAVIARRLEHFVSRAGLAIEGLGPVSARRLVDAGLVAEPADLFSLSSEVLGSCLGLGERAARRLAERVSAARSCRWSQLLLALGVEGVGPSWVAPLTAAFPDLKALLAARREALLALPGMGPGRADALAAWLADTERRAELARCVGLGLGTRGQTGQREVSTR